MLRSLVVRLNVTLEYANSMQVGDIIRKVSYRDKIPFGAYYQVLSIDVNNIYIRFLDSSPGARPMELEKRKAKYYAVYSYRHVLVTMEEFKNIFPKVGSVPKICTWYVEPKERMKAIEKLCHDPKKKPKFLIFGAKHSEKKVVRFEGVYVKIINGEPKIKFVLDSIVGTYE